ncbi:hypothetical protein GGR55DRAFT_272553 [Xylaria sp. FL0064]|nr:hypothetical protein GGR55DRAFT_272553 [Xylaria sp. FL0064]
MLARQPFSHWTVAGNSRISRPMLHVPTKRTPKQPRPRHSRYQSHLRVCILQAPETFASLIGSRGQYCVCCKYTEAENTSLEAPPCWAGSLCVVFSVVRIDSPERHELLRRLVGLCCWVLQRRLGYPSSNSTQKWRIEIQGQAVAEARSQFKLRHHFGFLACVLAELSVLQKAGPHPKSMPMCILGNRNNLGSFPAVPRYPSIIQREDRPAITV